MRTLTTILFLVISYGLFISCKENTKYKNDTINIYSTKLKINDESKKNGNTTNSINELPELFKIEGTYTFEDSIAQCILKLEIFKIKKNYTYKLKTTSRNLTGEVSLKLGEKNDGYYISLNKIPWSENLGQLNDEGEPVDKNIKLPKSLEGYLYENVISIQNYGNSMNYYMQLGECDTKYIQLEKITKN